MIINIPASLLIHANLDWTDVSFLYDQGWINKKELMNYASNVLTTLREKEIENYIIDLLNSKNEDYEIKKQLNNICYYLQKNHNDYCLDRILFCLFSWLRNQDLKLVDFLDIIENIYCELGHPKEISMFIRYMPANQEETIKINSIDNLKKSIDHYLSSKK